MKKVLVCLFLLISQYSYAQKDSVFHKFIKQFDFSAYTEVYYGHDFSMPQNHERPVMIINHKRTNEMNLNIAYLRVNYHSNVFRTNLSFMAGTYSQYNLALEQGMLKNIYDANIGMKIYKNWWVDAGIFPSYIGGESVRFVDNKTLTRSVIADNTPYYKSGLKVGYEKKDTLQVYFYVLNGWQNIAKINQQFSPSIGTQINWFISPKFSLNYNTFVGNMGTDAAPQMRYFHDIYCQWEIVPKFKALVLFDFGMQENSTFTNYSYVFAPNVQLEYLLHKKWQVNLRGEYIYDRFNMLTPPVGLTDIGGVSIGTRFSPFPFAHIALEGKWLNSSNAVFTDRLGNPARDNFVLTFGMAADID